MSNYILGGELISMNEDTIQFILIPKEVAEDKEQLENLENKLNANWLYEGCHILPINNPFSKSKLFEDSKSFVVCILLLSEA